MNLLKKWLTTVSALKSINYHKSADDIVFAINVNNHEGETVLIQYAANSKQKWYPIRYESSVLSPQKAAYNTGQRECKGILLTLKKL